jgi:SPP1 gp7 family putative phage head morphogenesis protein
MTYHDPKAVYARARAKRAPRPRIAQDRGTLSPRSALKRAKRLETQYAQRLRGIARTIGHIVAGYDLSNLATASPAIVSALRRYADVLRPWARVVGQRMIAEVGVADRTGWRKIAAEIGRPLAREIADAPTGRATQEALERQVTLITSIPTDAAERVHKLTIDGLAKGKRADEIAAEIMKTSDVSKARANLIASTEISRTATEFTKARALHIGSTQYIWRTSNDSDVRPDHKVLNGKVFDWSDPPIADRRTGARAHPGCIYRCRCYPEPIIVE